MLCSHSSGAEDLSLLGRDNMSLDEYFPLFQRIQCVRLQGQRDEVILFGLLDPEEEDTAILQNVTT